MTMGSISEFAVSSGAGVVFTQSLGSTISDGELAAPAL